jgi:hypothetical protein
MILAGGVHAQNAQLQCDIGPITKTFGSVPWLVDGCHDGGSVVLVSAPGSPAAPFYFIFSYESGGYNLRGEGTGAKSATDAALKELQALAPGQIRALRREVESKRP